MARRRKRFGPNRLLQAPRTRARAILWSQVSSPLIGLLVLAGVAAALWQEWLEAAAILIVIVVNTSLGFYTELRAVRSMEALLRLGRVRTRVIRGGTDTMVDAEELVPGDLVVLDAGDVVTADMRLLEGSHLQVDESMLTGESLPVGKTPAPVRVATPLAERTGMLYKGTSVLRGSARALVVSTGMTTELGAISALVRDVRSDRTPLEEQLAGLGRRLLGVTVLVALGITLVGILGGRELLLMVETGVALAIATIPEGLPVVATLAMARGIHRMAAQRALLRSLASVETLGSTSVVLTDKTGTLTENRMAVRGLEVVSGRVTVDVDAAPARRFQALPHGTASVPDELDLIDALRIAVLCSSAHLGRGADTHTGDPMEVALLLAGRACGLEREDLLEEEPEWDRVAFDPETQRMATRHRGARGARIAVKGAPEAVLAVCTRERAGQRERALDATRRAWWLDRNAAWAADGYRVLGLAAGEDDGSADAPHRDRVWIGLVALLDPPRVGVDRALATCAAAGITVVMVTGDQGGTARTVAESVGIGAGGAEVVTGAQMDQETLSSEALLSARVFARVTPRHKLELVRLHQGAGRTVAMTGDGVNDAPALRQADIGIAMGARGTEVAKEAADMILEDDSFATIVTAVQLGRVIFDNIRAFVVYLLSCNVSEVMVVAVGSVLGTPLPVLPLQLLFLNFVTDVFPALALGVGEGSANVMERPPRPRAEPIVQPRAWAFIAGYGTLITGAVLGALLVALHLLDLGEDGATTVSFLTLALAQLWHVFTMRARTSPLFVNEITRNRWVWGALALCLALLLAAVYLPVLARPLGLVPPGRSGWALAVGASLTPWSIGLALGWLRRAV